MFLYCSLKSVLIVVEMCPEKFFLFDLCETRLTRGRMSEALYNRCVRGAGQALHGLTLELELSVLLFLLSFVLVFEALWSTRVGNSSWLQQSFFPHVFYVRHWLLLFIQCSQNHVAKADIVEFILTEKEEIFLCP